MNEQEQAAIEAVARRFSTTWEEGGDPREAHVVVAGKRIAVDIRTLERRAGDRNPAAPRLRFDKVVTRVLERLRARLAQTVPAGITVLVTITAPIRLPSKTAAALEDRIRTLLARGSPGRDARDTIHGNRVVIRVLRHDSKRPPPVIGFVHNSGSGPLQLLDTTRAVLELTAAEADKRARSRAGDRWLVITTADGSSWSEAYRDILSQLRMTTDYDKVLTVFADGRVEALTG